MQLRTINRRLRWLLRWSLIAVAVLALGVWAASRWRMIAADAYWRGVSYTFLIRYGRVEYWGLTNYQLRASSWPRFQPAPRYTVLFSWQPIDNPEWWWSLRQRWPGQPIQAIIPLWWIALPSALAAAGLWRLERRFLHRGGLLCPRCDYDLAGLEEGRPCPECGLERAKKTGP